MIASKLATLATGLYNISLMLSSMASRLLNNASYLALNDIKLSLPSASLLRNLANYKNKIITAGKTLNLKATKVKGLHLFFLFYFCVIT